MTDDTEVRVTFEHLRQLKYCAPRVRAWCKQHDIPLAEFRVGHGVPVSRLRATGCGMALRAADFAEGNH